MLGGTGKRIRKGVADHGAAGRGEYSVTLERLTRYTLGHKMLVAAVWIGVGVLLALAFPQLETVVRQQSVDPIPAGVPSFQALDRMGQAFGETGAKTTVVIAMENHAGLTDQTRAQYNALVQQLRANTKDVQSVHDLLADPITAQQAVSSDKQAWYLPVAVSGTFGGPDAATAVEHVRSIANKAFTGSGTIVKVTGPPATFADQITAAESDLVVITAATVALIAVILLLVYRSVVTAILPLLVIGLSVGVARGVLSAAGTLGMPVSQFTVAFTTVILLGAGVDYSVFLISRYHENIRRRQSTSDALIGATATIGRVIAASAATVALAFSAMIFAKLSVFATLGPACAIAIFVGFAATVTLLPPVLAVAARFGMGGPRRDLTRRYWSRIGVQVVRHPAPLLITGLVGLVALSLIGLTLHVTYDDRTGQPSTTDSNEGYTLLDQHFPKDVIITEFLVVSSPTDLRTAKGLADLDQMAGRIAQLPGVSKVVGITRPTGNRLDQAQLSWQNGQIGDRLAGAVNDGQAHKTDLNQLAAGTDQLANGLDLLHTEVTNNLAPLTGLLRQAADAGNMLRPYQPILQQLAQLRPQLDQLAHQTPPIAQQADSALAATTPLLATLNTAPWCTQLPTCIALRDQANTLTALHRDGFFTQLSTLLNTINTNQPAASPQQLQTTTTALLNSLGNVAGQDLPAKLNQLQTGIGQLAAGAHAISAGVHALVDSNLQTLAGMAQVATQLQQSARATTGSDAATGFYLPATAFSDHQFNDLARQFVSPDGHTIRYAIQTKYDPYSSAAMKLATNLTAVANSARPNTTLSDATIAVAGFPAINSDLQRLLGDDFQLLVIATLLIVGLILIALLKALIAPLYLLATVVLNYTAALGFGVLIFQHLLHQDIAWPVPILAFIVLVAVGADYNMLLVSRLREESTHNIRVGVLRTVTNTGSVITSAGLIFAASMFGLMTGSIGIMTQAGLIIGVGLLIDTFIVRTIVVPAIATTLRDTNWWPQKRPR